MKEQPSKRAIELRLEWLNKALGRPLTPNWGKRESSDEAAFYIDHQLGGYRIECAGHSPFGYQRMTKRELCDQLEAILVAIKLARGENDGSNWSDKAPDGTQIKPEEPRPYQPKTGQPCNCKPGIERDNCPKCEGTGMRIDFAAIRAR